MDSPEPPNSAPSEDSLALTAYYKRLQDDLLVQGLLRTDGGGPETPFTDAILARNFVRIGAEFGASVDAAQRSKDKQSLQGYAARLSDATGHPIRYSEANPNFHVLFLSSDDVESYANRIREIVPGIERSSLNAMLNAPRSQLCVVVSFSEAGSLDQTRAIAVIRAEHPDLLRQACIHEEVAQGLGLVNDSEKARPSIFNDDEEFALLTPHDELLLRMLYDPRLKIGMTAAEAAPIARQIARELLAPTPS